LSENGTVLNHGESKFVARARIMLVLGEQLITDEVAAVYELIKNSYDADATKVKIRPVEVTNADLGKIEIKDNGSGMSRETLLTGWLELATPRKARGSGDEPRYSQKRNRLILGEKGIGRLAVHKLGDVTEIVTRLEGAQTETRLVVDWKKFEDRDRFLESVPVQWEERTPQVFLGTSEDGFESGTRITVTSLRSWNAEKILRLSRGVDAMISPLFGLKEFEPELIVNDKSVTELSERKNVFDYLKNVPYTFDAAIDRGGNGTYKYDFVRKDFPDLNRKIVPKEQDFRDPSTFSKGRKPSCGPFRLRLYSWELIGREKRETFGDTAIYEEIIKPNSGVKVFRDGFRVLPYGDRDNDWLGLDHRRVGEFEERVSRNLVVGVIDISSTLNPLLIDKSDREGLIGNQAFEDFRSLVLSVLTQFEAERLIDRQKLKDRQERTRASRSKFIANMTRLEEILEKEGLRLLPETKYEITRLVTDSREIFQKSIEDAQSPLLAAASIGLTYMIPTHEARRDIQNAMKTLRTLLEDERATELVSPIRSAILLLRQAQEVIAGIADIMQISTDQKAFRLKRAADHAISLMKYRLSRAGITHSTIELSQESVIGLEKRIVIALINMIDNSAYWLNRIPEGRQLKIIIGQYQNQPAIIVSDNGPGVTDDISTITVPFFTRKPNGTGLGLFICDRIADQHKASLRLMNSGDMPGLLPGANIGIIFPNQPQ